MWAEEIELYWKSYLHLLISYRDYKTLGASYTFVKPRHLKLVYNRKMENFQRTSRKFSTERIRKQRSISFCPVTRHTESVL